MCTGMRAYACVRVCVCVCVSVRIFDISCCLQKKAAVCAAEERPQSSVVSARGAGERQAPGLSGLLCTKQQLFLMTARCGDAGSEDL